MSPPGRDLPRRVSQYTLRGEQVILWRQQHHAVWLGPSMAFIGSLIAGGWIRAQVPTAGMADLVTFGWLLAAFYATWRFVAWQMFCFVLTDRRVMLFHGVLTRKVAMMPITKVTDLTYQQTAIGALLRYGDVIVESAGQDQALRQVGYLPDPHRLYQEISSVLFTSRMVSPEDLARQED